MNIPIKKSILIELLETQRDNYHELASIASRQCESAYQDWKKQYLSKWWRQKKTFKEEFLRNKHEITNNFPRSIPRAFLQYAREIEKKIKQIEKFAGDQEIYVSEQELADLQKTKKPSRFRHFVFPACG